MKRNTPFSRIGRHLRQVFYFVASVLIAEAAEPFSAADSQSEGARSSRGHGQNPVTSLVGSIEIGGPEQYRSLTVFPLLLSQPAVALDLRTLDEALREGWIEIREKENAEVPVVLVRNNSRYRVFLMAGEVIAGGKQNRMVRDDVLLRPQPDFVEIPVYCGERGRWAGSRPMFEATGILAHPELRRKVATGEAQSSVWLEIESHSMALGVDSTTRDYRHTYEEAGVREKLEDCVRRFRRPPKRDTVGLVAAFGGRILGCDIFSDPELLAKLWEKLIRSHAVEGLRSEWAGKGGEVAQELVRDFLRQVFRASYLEKSSPGEGYLLALSGSVEGAALIWNENVVHLALFGEESRCPMPPRPPRPGPPIIPFNRPDADF